MLQLAPEYEIILLVGGGSWSKGSLGAGRRRSGTFGLLELIPRDTYCVRSDSSVFVTHFYRGITIPGASQ